MRYDHQHRTKGTGLSSSTSSGTNNSKPNSVVVKIEGEKSVVGNSNGSERRCETPFRYTFKSLTSLKRNDSTSTEFAMEYENYSTSKFPPILTFSGLKALQLEEMSFFPALKYQPSPKNSIKAEKYSASNLALNSLHYGLDGGFGDMEDFSSLSSSSTSVNNASHCHNGVLGNSSSSTLGMTNNKGFKSEEHEEWSDKKRKAGDVMLPLV